MHPSRREGVLLRDGLLHMQGSEEGGGREGGREEGWREGWRKGGREGGREGEREEGREGGRVTGAVPNMLGGSLHIHMSLHCACMYVWRDVPQNVIRGSTTAARPVLALLAAWIMPRMVSSACCRKAVSGPLGRGRVGQHMQ